MKKRIFSTLLTVLLSAELLSSAAFAADEVLLIAPAPTAADTAAVTEWTAPLSIAGELPEGNLLLGRSAFNKKDYISDFKLNNNSMEYLEDENGGCFKISGITYHYIGVDYTIRGSVEPGTYKFTGYFRTANEGEISRLRVHFKDSKNEIIRTLHINISNEWIKAEFYFETDRVVDSLSITGGSDSRFIQDFCIDHFSIVPVEEIPEEMVEKNTIGEMIDAQDALESMLRGEMYIKPYDAQENAQHDVQGIIINGDSTFFQMNVYNSGCTITEQEIIDYARQFEGSHITDYMICVNGQSAVYPSEFDTDYLEKYYMKEENGIAVDYTDTDVAAATKHIFETLGTDYIGLWCETFSEIGINPWLSFRMNDVHNMRSDKTYVGFSDFWHNNPQYYRITHRKVRENDGYAFNYTYREVREYFLGKINDALNRYDCYGIELDFQREMALWHIGGEYRGVDILNEFMREVDDLVAVYEEKYSHEIKIGVRVASDPITCMDFGLDVITWVTEGIVNMVSPCSRLMTTDFDIPVRLWKSILAPYNVELAPGIEQNIASYRDQVIEFGEKRHNLDTMAACAANALSQGADKIYFYNYFYGLTPVKKVSTNTTLYTVTSPEGYWNVITTLGSYDKVMTLNRRHLLAFNDTHQIWKDDDNQLPKEIARNQPTTFAIAVGDVPEYADVYLKFSSSEAEDTHKETPPTVYVNSVEAEYVKTEAANGLTNNKILCYKVPDSVKNGGKIVFEVVSTVKCTIDYVEVYVQAVH